jgi:hypothetical protein
MSRVSGAFEESPERDDRSERTPDVTKAFESLVPETKPLPARRAAQESEDPSPDMAPPEETSVVPYNENGGKYVFTGKEDFYTWKRTMQGQLLFKRKEPLIKQAEHVMRQVQGDAMEIMLNDIDFSILPASEDPFDSAAKVFAALEEVYGTKSDRVAEEAMTKLANCYQGKRKLEEFLQEFIPLAGRAGLTEAQKIAMMKGKIGQKWKMPAAMSRATTLGEFTADMKLVDQMVRDTPSSGDKKSADKTDKTSRGRAAREKKDITKIECHNCHKLGHYANKCPDNAPAKQVLAIEAAGEADIADLGKD